MAREPSYPEEASVGTKPQENGKKESPGKNKQLMTGAAIGIGSAAIVAALLYANRNKRGDKGGNG